MPMPESLKILVSPLDWGLGHATRMIPLLRYLSELNHQLFIGVNESTIDFLQEQFPEAIFLHIPSYHIKFSESESSFSLLKLIPKIMKAKKEENLWVKNFVKENPVDFIISDSRFGFYHLSIPSVIISHQLNLQYPKAYFLLGKFAQMINERWLRKFSQVWVPDTQNHFLSGKLSENTSLNTVFIKPQSRLQNSKADNPLGKEYVLAILSGPEPHRSILEKLLISQASSIEKQLVIIGGKPQDGIRKYELKNVLYYNHLQDTEMTAYIQNASLIISRSGYSSIMDYYTLACKSLFLIPTPGQTEQIYLAQRMKDMERCDFEHQGQFNLAKVSTSSSKWTGFLNNKESIFPISELIENLIS